MNAEVRTLCAVTTDIFGKRFGSECTHFALQFNVDLTQGTLYVRAVRKETELISTKSRCKVSTPNLTRIWWVFSEVSRTQEKLSNAYIVHKT